MSTEDIIALSIICPSFLGIAAVIWSVFAREKLDRLSAGASIRLYYFHKGKKFKSEEDRRFYYVLKVSLKSGNVALFLFRKDFLRHRKLLGYDVCRLYDFKTPQELVACAHEKARNSLRLRIEDREREKKEAKEARIKAKQVKRLMGDDNWFVLKKLSK